MTVEKEAVYRFTVTESEPEKSKKSKCMICTILLSLLALSVAIIGLMYNQNNKNTKEENGKLDAGAHVEGCESDHPMCQFYN